MKEEELKQINGGGFSATLFNAIARGVRVIYDLGVSTGSAIRRAVHKKVCAI